MILLSVSSKGELAVLTNPKGSVAAGFRGTLARMTMDGTPRPWQDDVLDADWSPNGENAAITRQIGNGVRLEYPIGERLYETPRGSLRDLRVSPDGTRVAFFEQPITGDDRGWVKVIGANGRDPRTLYESQGLAGLAWSGDSRSLYFSAETPGKDEYQPFVVNVDGPLSPHQVIGNDGIMIVLDVHDRSLLVSRNDRRWSIRVRVPGEDREREFWPPVWGPAFLSSDAKTIIFTEQSERAGGSWVAAWELATGHSHRLGDAGSDGFGVSPNGKWVAAYIASAQRWVLYPIGSGDPINLPKGPLTAYKQFMQWFPDSQAVLVCGTEAGDAQRCYKQNLVGGVPKPVTAKDVVEAYIASDSRTLLVAKTDGSYNVATVGEPSGHPVQGLTSSDQIVGWASTGLDLVVQEVSDGPSRVTQVNPYTGARRPLRTIGPPDHHGGVRVTQWIADGRGYTYVYSESTSRLLVAKGVGQ